MYGAYKMNYINYSGGHGVETVEDMRGMSRAEKIALIKDYRLVSGNYYASSRATKDFYATNKQGEK